MQTTIPSDSAYGNTEHRYEDNFFEEVYYGARRLLPRILSSDGLSFRSQMAGLKAGHSVTMTLEPGDATRYPLCITPTWSSRVFVSGCTGEARTDYLIVTYLREGYDKEMLSTIVPRWSTFNVNSLSLNEHSRDVLQWFLDGVWKYLEEDK